MASKCFYELFPKLSSKSLTLVFLIVGAGELEKDVESLRQELRTQGRLVTTGGVDHSRAMELISAIDIGLMPHSNTWGSPMKILEYMPLVS